MGWEPDGNVSVFHQRERWSPSEPTQILVHSCLNILRGKVPQLNQRSTLQAAYRAAKYEFNAGAALDIVERCIRESVIEDVANIVFYCDCNPRIVFPHLRFDDDEIAGAQDPTRQLPTNAIPFAYAKYLGDVLGCAVDEGIIQIARVGRTALSDFARFLYQPDFAGDVERGHDYLLVDDVVTTAGGLAALRSFIIRNGGNVIGVSVLANSKGRYQRFPIADESLKSLNVLRSLYGRELEVLWVGAIGHELNCLTEREGESLMQWGRDRQVREGVAAGTELLHRLRTRLNKAAATGR
jgi:hypothetical protein